MTNLLFTSLAFRLIAQQMMTNDAELARRHLGLNELPVGSAAIVEAHFWPRRGFIGKIITTNYCFTFTSPVNSSTQCAARLTLIERHDYVGPRQISLIRRVVDTPSRITRNEAFQLATQWLAALSVDVTKLPRAPDEVEIQQEEIGQKALDPSVDVNDADVLFGERSRRPVNEPLKLRKLPIYSITWGAGDLDAYVVILGTTKELLTLSVRSHSVLTNQPLTITNFVELLSRRDTPSPK